MTYNVTHSGAQIVDLSLKQITKDKKTKLHADSGCSAYLLLPDHASRSLGGLAAFPEAEALDVAVCGDPQRLCRRLHLVDLHLGCDLLWDDFTLEERRLPTFSHLLDRYADNKNPCKNQ